jgi:DNA polymerase V
MGFPSPAKDYAEERISLDKQFIQHPNSTFFMRMQGLSMVSAFIPPGALLVIDRSLIAKNMDIVVAVVNGEYTVRYLRKNDFKAWLVPANSKMKEELITPEMEVVIWGVITAVVTETKTLPSCML